MSEEKPFIFEYTYIEPAEVSKTPGLWPIKIVTLKELKDMWSEKNND